MPNEERTCLGQWTPINALGLGDEARGSASRYLCQHEVNVGLLVLLLLLGMSKIKAAVARGAAASWCRDICSSPSHPPNISVMFQGLGLQCFYAVGWAAGKAAGL